MNSMGPDDNRDLGEIDDLFPFTLTRSVLDMRMGILTFRERAEYPVAQTGPEQLHHPWDIFRLNAAAIAEDWMLVASGRASQPIPSSVQAISPENIFIEPGAMLGYCTLNASTGPIYIGSRAEIMEGSLIRGPFALCHGATVKMGTKIYGATTIGPNSVVGGEIKNSVIFGNSNKAHDGYLGDAVIGE